MRIILLVIPHFKHRHLVLLKAQNFHDMPENDREIALSCAEVICHQLTKYLRYRAPKERAEPVGREKRKSYETDFADKAAIANRHLRRRVEK